MVAQLFLGDLGAQVGSAGGRSGRAPGRTLGPRPRLTPGWPPTIRGLPRRTP